MATPLRRPAGAAATGGPQDGIWAPERRALSIGLLLAVTLVAFESLSVATIMPVVGKELADLQLYGWVFSAFFLGDLVGIVASGAQADRAGLVRPFALGLGLFAVGLVIDGLAPNMVVLVVGRSIQGFGAGAVPTVAYVAIGRRYPDRVRPLMFAAMSSAWVVPGLAGPAIAGLVADHASWRYVFLGLLPLVGLAALITTPALRHRTAVEVGDGPDLLWQRLRPALRVAVGAALVLGALTARDLIGALLGAVGLVVGLPALRQLVPAGTLRAARGLPAVILLRGVVTFGFFGAEAFLPLTLVSVRGASATEAGLALTAATLTWTAGSWAQARLMGSWGAGRLIRVGLVIVTLGIAGVATVLASVVPVEVGVASWGLAGLGMGLAYSPISLTVIRDARPGEEGGATSAMQLCDVLGTALGTGLGGAIVAAGVAMAVEAHLYLAVAFSISVAISILGVALSGRIRRPAVVPA